MNIETVNTCHYHDSVTWLRPLAEVYNYTHVPVHTKTYVRLFLHISIYMCKNKCTYVFVYIYIYIYIYRIAGIFRGVKVLWFLWLRGEPQTFLLTKQYRIVLGCGLVYCDHENVSTNWPKIHYSRKFNPLKNTRYTVQVCKGVCIYHSQI